MSQLSVIKQIWIEANILLQRIDSVINKYNFPDNYSSISEKAGEKFLFHRRIGKSQRQGY